jgi:IS5 family transposase
VIADPIYGTRANRNDLKQRGIHFAGKPLGRPKQVTDANHEQLKQEKAQRRQDYLQRIPIEGKFGQGKNGYRLNDIRAKRANTSFAWINTIFLVMNLMILQRIFFALCQCGLAGLIKAVAQALKHRVLTQRARSVPLSRSAGTSLWLIY